jgi:two-component system KDP operon response regulator KdpE
MSSHKLILLVEDEATLRRIIARNLVARGHRVVEADSARDALARLNEDEPDLLLLDINLPGRSGCDILREIRRQGENVPAVIVSAVRLDPVRLDEFGPLSFHPKPFSLAALPRIVAAERPKEGELVP